MKGSVKLLVAPAAAASAEWRLKDHKEITAEVALAMTAVAMAMEEVEVAAAAAEAAAATTTSPSV